MYRDQNLPPDYNYLSDELDEPIIKDAQEVDETYLENEE